MPLTDRQRTIIAAFGGFTLMAAFGVIPINDILTGTPIQNFIPFLTGTAGVFIGLGAILYAYAAK